MTKSKKKAAVPVATAPVATAPVATAPVATAPVPPPDPRFAADGERFIDRHELLDRIPISYPKLWELMRDGKFPRAREVGGRSLWLASEIDFWFASQPVRPLKGDVARSDQRLPPDGRRAISARRRRRD